LALAFFEHVPEERALPVLLRLLDAGHSLVKAVPLVWVAVVEKNVAYVAISDLRTFLLLAILAVRLREVVEIFNDSTEPDLRGGLTVFECSASVILLDLENLPSSRPDVCTIVNGDCVGWLAPLRAGFRIVEA
jgi:hypothetical protein